MKFIRSIMADDSPLGELRWKSGEIITRGRQGASGHSGERETDGGATIAEAAVTEMIPPSVLERSADEPFSLRPIPGVDNPVVTAAAVSGHGDADFVADPFLFVEDETWHLFFEISNRYREPPAVIGHATSTNAGLTWSFTDVVLRTDTHLAFPYVFEWNESYYMIPDRWDHVHGEPRDIKLYRATNFPAEWTEIGTLVSPSHRLNDFVAFQFDDRWWGIGGDGRDLYAYYSDKLTAENWTPHYHNPVVSDRPQGARPGGRPIVRDDRILLYLQDCVERYGSMLRAFEVSQLTTDAYADREHPQSPVLVPDERVIGWNAGKMHHIDSVYVDGQWRCVVDGNIGLQRVFGNHHWAIGLFDA